jgi:hypothetical protein
MVGSSRHVNAHKKKGLNFLLEYHILLLTRQWSEIASEYLVHAKNQSIAYVAEEKAVIVLALGLA